MIYDAWKIQGVRGKLSDPQTKRHEFKSTHSFRKIFETKCQKAKMNHNHIKLLMDHSLGDHKTIIGLQNKNYLMIILMLLTC